MSSIESPAVRNAFDEFLKRACEIAKGDTRKSINNFEIWNDDFPIKGLDRSTYLPIILRSLKASNFIQDGDNEDEIKVALKGIYYVVDTLKVPPENLGVLSRSDLKRIGNVFLRTLYEETKGDTTRSVSIFDIQKKALGGIHGTAPIRQISEYLKMKGLIEVAGNEDQIKIPSKQINKYYPPPTGIFFINILLINILFDLTITLLHIQANDQNFFLVLLFSLPLTEGSRHTFQT